MLTPKLRNKASRDPEVRAQGDPRTTLPRGPARSGYGKWAQLPRWPFRTSQRAAAALAKLVRRRGFERASEALVRWAVV
jgi:hypothetical protein